MRSLCILSVCVLVLLSSTASGQSTSAETPRVPSAGSLLLPADSSQLWAGRWPSRQEEAYLRSAAFPGPLDSRRPPWLLPVLGGIVGGTYFGLTYDCNDCWISRVPWTALGAGLGVVAGGVIELIAGDAAQQPAEHDR